MGKTIIIGAGITGLSVAYHLKKPCTILEREQTPGGLCRSARTSGGCTFDYSGHFLHFHHPETKKLVERVLLKGNIEKIERDTWIHTHGVYVPFPFQANLFALPEKIKDECVRGAGDRPALPKTKFLSFYRWSVATFGAGITKYFMKPYNEKLWTVPAETLNSDWTAPFVPKPSLKEIISGAEAGRQKRYGYNASFYYPKNGGIQSLIDALAENVNGLVTGAEIESIDPAGKSVTTRRGEQYRYDSLVSTMPLVKLAGMINGLPPAVKRAADKLKWNTVHCLNIAFRDKYAGPELRGKHWVYFPEKKFDFYRAGVYTNISRRAAPKGYCSMYVELSAPGGKGFNGRAALPGVKDGLIRSGMLDGRVKLEAADWFDIPFAYVIYDRDRAGAVAAIQKYLKEAGIHSVGRYGAWKYSFMEESLWEGKLLAEKLNGQD
jgi:protoporphyrinogen oxidase